MQHNGKCAAGHDDEARCTCEDPTHIIYHGNCFDGFGSAWAAEWRFGRAPVYIPAFYGVPPPELPADAVVLMLDFSYRRDAMVALAGRVKSVLVIDHHKTAEAELADFMVRTHPDAPNLKVLFDGAHSGAVLTWQHFSPYIPVPMLLRYVEDRDLWRHALPHSEEVHAAIASYPMEFDVWSRLAEDMTTLANIGGHIRRSNLQQVEAICRNVTFDTISGYLVPIVNATTHFSDVGHRLCELYPCHEFSMYYLDRADGKRQWGLRSIGEFDVSAVAKQHGGGGHKNAAGFETSFGTWYWR